MFQAVLVEGVPDEKRKSCYDCGFCLGALSWWCTNKEAIKARGTSFPGIIGCPYWKPTKTLDELSRLQRKLGGYIEIREEVVFGD